jgi:2-methylcitrate dehydratase PrpD
MALSLTEGLAAFVAGLDERAIPEAARRAAHVGWIDCVGVMIAGSGADAPRLLHEVLAPTGGESTLYFGTQRAGAPEAAWLNGTAAHALDFDDTGVRGHPSTVLVPAIAAEAEHLDLSGAQMLRAYVAGYETWAELALRERDSVHAKGWHPTGIWGAVAAAAACAALRGLDARRAQAALALGASQSAGLVANFGTMTKPFHAGRAAHAGVMAARLAQAGYTASPDAFEHPQGLLRAVSERGNTDWETPPSAGQRWRLVEEGLNVKQYPLCYCTHRAIDGLLALRAAHRFAAEDVQTIGVEISERYRAILRNRAPRTGLEAKFSIEFALACSAIAGRVGLGELTDAFVSRADVQALMKHVEVRTGTDYDPLNPNAAPSDRVWVVLKNGQTLEGEPVTHARGHARVPLSQAELFGKFSACLESVGLASQAGPLFERLVSFERVSARELMRGGSHAARAATAIA